MTAVEAEGPPTLRRVARRGDERIARGRAHAFAKAVEEPRQQHERPERRQRQQRFREG